jgi:hypothetical protein
VTLPQRILNYRRSGRAVAAAGLVSVTTTSGIQFNKRNTSDAFDQLMSLDLQFVHTIF